ncbi:protein stu1-like [Impatiens glandulifera]|uniref:protein stu1-like n=1 Tax=Impatiens glandulifera TaxID=253017 RepID=UPI001FB170E3|nr:protein stu1-like [Impatiens glandulifera]
MVEDIDTFLNFPWEKVSFRATINGLNKDLDRYRLLYLEKKKAMGKKNKEKDVDVSYIVYGKPKFGDIEEDVVPHKPEMRKKRQITLTKAKPFMSRRTRNPTPNTSNSDSVESATSRKDDESSPMTPTTKTPHERCRLDELTKELNELKTEFDILSATLGEEQRRKKFNEEDLTEKKKVNEEDKDEEDFKVNEKILDKANVFIEHMLNDDNIEDGLIDKDNDGLVEENNNAGLVDVLIEDVLIDDNIEVADGIVEETNVIVKKFNDRIIEEADEIVEEADVHDEKSNVDEKVDETMEGIVEEKVEEKVEETVEGIVEEKVEYKVEEMVEGIDGLVEDKNKVDDDFIVEKKEENVQKMVVQKGKKVVQKKKEEKVQNKVVQKGKKVLQKKVVQKNKVDDDFIVEKKEEKVQNKVVQKGKKVVQKKVDDHFILENKEDKVQKKDKQKVVDEDVVELEDASHIDFKRKRTRSKALLSPYTVPL